MGLVSTLPLLLAAQAGFLGLMLIRAFNRDTLLAAAIIATSLGAWAVATSLMGRSGFYQSDRFLMLMPGLWLPAVPFVVVGITLIFATVRSGLVQMADSVPTHWFVAIQALRMTALGTLVKTIQGDFPVEVELAIGLTDLTFGLSAVWLFFLARHKAISADALILWHIVGVLIVVMPGELAMQSGLPGPHRVFSDDPTSEAMLDWPMVLAPSLVVPIFLIFNIIAATALYRARQTPSYTKENSL